MCNRIDLLPKVLYFIFASSKDIGVPKQITLNLSILGKNAVVEVKMRRTLITLAAHFVACTDVGTDAHQLDHRKSIAYLFFAEILHNERSN